MNCENNNEMIVRKYIFFIKKDGIMTYKMSPDGFFELKKPSGEDTFPSNDLNLFFSQKQWFDKNAAITSDEYIDFCFLSEYELDNLPILNDKYRISSKSSWNKQEIQDFCKKYLNLDTFKVFCSKDKYFIIQSTNVFDEKEIKTLFIKCIPEFSIETEKIVSSCREKSNKFDLNPIFIDMLNNIRNKKN